MLVAAKKPNIYKTFAQTCTGANPGLRFEFYHWYITENCKTFVENVIASGFLHGVPATDTLGQVGCFFIAYIV